MIILSSRVTRACLIVLGPVPVWSEVLILCVRAATMAGEVSCKMCRGDGVQRGGCGIGKEEKFEYFFLCKEGEAG